MGSKNLKFEVGDTVIFNNRSRECNTLLRLVFGEGVFSCVYKVVKTYNNFVKLMNKDGKLLDVSNEYLDLKPLAEYKTFLQFKFSISSESPTTLKCRGF